MKQAIKKALCVSLAVLMVLTLVPLGSFAGLALPFGLTADASADTGDVALESDWEIAEKNGKKYVIVSVNFTEAVELQSWSLELTYDAEVFDFFSKADGKDAKAVKNFCDSTKNSYEDESNPNTDGSITVAGYFKKVLWTADEFLANSNFDGDCVVDSDNFEAALIYLAIDEEKFAAVDTTISIAGQMVFGEKVEGQENNQIKINVADSVTHTVEPIPEEPPVVTPGDAAVTLESDWEIAEDNTVAVDIYFENCVGLKSWDLFLSYDADLFSYDGWASGSDTREVADCKDNSITTETNENYDVGYIKTAGYFKESLWTAEEFLANSNRGEECVVNSAKFHLGTIYLKIEDAARFASENTSVIISETDSNINITSNIAVSAIVTHKGDSDLAPAVTLESDWSVMTLGENKAIAVNVYFVDAVELQSWDLNLTYDADMFNFYAKVNGADADEVGKTLNNSFTDESNGNVDGTINVAGYFKEVLWTADKFASDSNPLKGTATVNSDKFAATVFYLIVEDEAKFAAEDTEISISGKMVFGAKVEGQEDNQIKVDVADAITHTVDPIPDEPPVVEPGDPAVTLESDWVIASDGTIAVDIYFENCVGLKTWDLFLSYDADLFSYDGWNSGRDTREVADCKDNSITTETNGNYGVGYISTAGYFKESLWTSEEFLANSNRGEECVVNSAKFHLGTIYLKIEDAEKFASENTSVIISETDSNINITSNIAVSAIVTHKGDSDLAPAVILESDWEIAEDNTVKVDVFLKNSIGLITWDLNMYYSENLFSYYTYEPGTDARAVNDYCASDQNTITMECNGYRNDGIIKTAGYFKQSLWTAEEFAANSNREGTCTVNADKFHALTFYFTVADPANFAMSETAITMDGLLEFDGHRSVETMLEKQAAGYGDVNGDGFVTPEDARLTLRIAVGLENAAEHMGVAADVNKDGDITASDSRTILRACLGLDTIENAARPASEQQPTPGAIHTGAVEIESDWEIVTKFGKECVAVDVYLTDAVDLTSFYLNLAYDADVFNYYAKTYGADARAVLDYCEAAYNSYTDADNGNDSGAVVLGGYFKENLWTADEFLANSNFDGDCIVDSDRFHFATIYLEIEDQETFLTNELQIEIAGNLCFGDMVIGTQDNIFNLCPPGAHWGGWGECVIGTRTCDRCGTVYEVYAESHDHLWNEGVTTTAPTCTEKGEMVFTCQNNPEHTKTEEVAPLGHTPGAEATCTTDQICTVCKVVLTEKTGHTAGAAVMEDKAEATCETDGSYNMVVYCATCNEKLSTTAYTIPATGHDWEDDGVVTTPPTCTEKGVKTYTCKRDASHTKTEEIDPLGHTPGAPATCTEDQVCTVCGAVLTEKTGHTPVTHTEPAQCEVNGYTTTLCEVCGEELGFEIIPMLGHDWDDGVVTTPPTCTEKGVKTYTCKRDASHTKTEEIDPLGHTPGAPATCTEDQICTVCGEVLTEKTGHKPVTHTEPASCTVNGYIMTVCETCGDELSFETIPAFGHTAGAAVMEDKVEAFCETDGSYNMVVYCATCNEKLSSTAYTIPATGHTWSAWVTITEADFENEGLKKRTCSVCSKEESEVIPKSKEFKDEESGISVRTDKEAYDGKEVEVKIEEVFDGSHYLGQSFGNVETWNIKTYVDGEQVQPETPVYVKIPIPADFNEEKVFVYHINSQTGEREKMDVEIIDGYACFWTTSFSIYIVVDESTKAEVETDVFVIKPYTIAAGVTDELVLVVPGTTAADLFAASNATDILDANGEKVAEDSKLLAGMQLVIMDGEEIRDSMELLLIGDVNNDAEITSSDARTTLRYAVGLDKLNEKQQKAADVNGDGEITSSDARSILRASVDLDDPKSWIATF